MLSTMISGAAVLLAFAPSALAAGSAHVVNNCGFDIYYASVAQNVPAAMQMLPASGFSEAYSLPDVGISIKIAPDPSSAPTQFEFTWSSGKINYDISNIDGNPFEQWGATLAPSMAGDSNNPTCQVVSCPAGQSPCVQAYNAPDDTRTMVCDQDSDLTMTLCPGGSVPSPSESSTVTRSTTSVAAATPTEAPTSTTEAPPAATTTSWGWHGHANRYHARHLPKV